MPAPISPAKRVKTSHRTSAAPTSPTTLSPQPVPDPPPTPPANSTRHRLFIGGCPTNLTPSQLYTELHHRFSTFGHVTTVDVIVGEGGSKGFAYVELETGRLEAVLSTFRGSKWRGQWFRVEPALPDYLTRLTQHCPADTEVDQPTAVEEAGSEQSMDREMYCFRVRPGVRVRISYHSSNSIKQFDNTVQPLPLDQLAREEEGERGGEGEVSEKKEEVAEESMEEFRRRLQQSKEEVERTWLPQQNNSPTQQPHIDQLTKKQRLAIKRRERDEREQEEEEEVEVEREVVVEVADEEELGVVDFDNEETEEARKEEEKEAEEDKLAGMTEEERLKWQEEKEWAQLEDGGGEWMDEEVEHEVQQDEQPMVTHAERGEMSEVDEWAALEDGTAEEQATNNNEEEEEAKEESSSDEDDQVSEQQRDVIDMDDEADNGEIDNTNQASLTSTADQLSFPKLAAADWFDDDDDDDPSPPTSPSTTTATSMEQHMRTLSSQLIASNGEFNVRAEYEGKSGQQLLRLKQTYKGDERFTLDNRFATAAIDQHKATQAEEKTAEEAEEEDGEGGEVAGVEEGEKEFKRQLHAETVRALQVLDVVAPGPTPFHTTLPRFSHSTDKRASEAGVSEVEKDAAAIEAELNENEMRKSVTMWRNIQRYNPDKDDTAVLQKRQQNTAAAQTEVEAGGGEEEERERRESKTERKRRLRQERQERQRQQRQQSAITRPHWATAHDDESVEQTSGSGQQSSQRSAALYELGVPRLRDLVTDRSTVVQFSFAFDSTVSAAASSTADSSTSSAEAESDVAMNVYTPLPQVFPTRPAPVAVQPPAAIVQPIAGAALVKRGNSLHHTLLQRNTVDQLPAHVAADGSVGGGGKGRLSDILALAQQAHSSEGGGGTNTAAGPAAAGSDDDDDGGVFMRRTADGEIASEWKRWRANIREDYKKKNKSAVRAESNKQFRGGAASVPWAQSKRKASSQREDGGSKRE